MNTNNKVQLNGNLGNDPEIKSFDKAGKLATFRMATTDYFRNKDGERTSSTQWHMVTAWGKLAERIESELKKGSKVSVEGRLSTRNYTDKEGMKRYITEVVATELVVNGAEA